MSFALRGSVVLAWDWYWLSFGGGTRELSSCSNHSDGKDSHPSFRVYAPARPGGCCWHCYTVDMSGNVFNFLQMYYGLDAKALWSRILAGESL